ncbi:MAG: hypothetical protein RIR62_1716, partial [Pseudomonadota bacterium]
NDWVYGGAGNDWVLGDGGNDWISGDAGNDWIMGGAGADVFVFSGGQTGDIDVISDYERGVDLIAIDLPAGVTPRGVSLVTSPGTGGMLVIFAGQAVLVQNASPSTFFLGEIYFY